MMRTKRMLIYLFSSAILFSSCKPDELLKITKLQTDEIKDITYNSATAGATFIDLSGNVTSFGHCWSTNENPTVTDNKYIVNGSAQKGEYLSDLTNLISNTLYYVMAFAQEGDEVIYGNGITFTTLNTSITVTSPITGNHWVGSEEHLIQWTNDDFTGNVNIQLYKGGTYLRNIVSNIPNNGQYSWILPNDFVQASDYTIVITSINDVQIKGESQPFTASEVSGTEGPNFTYDGYVYNSVKIGAQWWMRQNLRNIHYRNGNSIYVVAPDWVTATTGIYCYYNDDVNTLIEYGNLYNWYAVNDYRGICPTGWHVPNNDELTLLINYLGGQSNAGTKLKEAGISHWITPNNGATNASGFTALPGGIRTQQGAYGSLGGEGVFWTSSEYNTDNANYYAFYYNRTDVDRDQLNKKFGFSVRCVRD